MGKSGSLKNAITHHIRVLYRPIDSYRILKDASFSHIALSFGILLLISCTLMAILLTISLGREGIAFKLFPITLYILGITILTLLLWGTVVLLISALILHIPVLLLGGRNGFIRTLMVVMYGSTPILLTMWIYPILTTFSSVGGIGIVIGYFLLVAAWSILLIARGLREVQEVPLTRSTVVAGVGVVVLFIIFASIAYFFMSLPPDTPLPGNQRWNGSLSARATIDRVNESMIVTNIGWNSSPEREWQPERIEVSRDGIVQGELDLDINSTLTIPAPSCPAEVWLYGYTKDGRKWDLEYYREKTCPNTIVNLTLIRHENSIEVLNDGGPRVDEISELTINIWNPYSLGNYTLGSKPSSSVIIPVPDYWVEVTIAAQLKNGASWRVASMDVEAYREADRSHTYTVLATITPAPPEMCAHAGDTIGAVGLPTRCCEGLDPIGGWPGGYTGSCLQSPPPGGLFICSDCGDGTCNTSTGENRCNCGADCS